MTIDLDKTVLDVFVTDEHGERFRPFLTLLVDTTKRMLGSAVANPAENNPVVQNLEDYLW